MLTVHDYEQIRRAYYIDKQSIRRIEREMGHSYWTVRKALDSAGPQPYQMRQPKAAPVLGAYKAQIEQLLAESAQLPRKQRYTSKKIYQMLRAAGYAGAESTVRYYVSQQRKAQRRPSIYLPLAFDPGVDAQVDWGEAQVVMAGEQTVVQLFVMRLCYSRKLFVMAFPTQRQEAFWWGHVCAFTHLGGVPQRISYDNLTTAVRRILQGRNRAEQESFVRLRSHYLFESRFCTPGQAHEKGGVENAVGYVRRNFLVPLPQVADFEALNQLLLAACEADAQRTLARSDQSIDTRWQSEVPYLHRLPPHPFTCCTSHEVTLNGYGQVSFETNRYSVPAAKAQKQLTLRAYPFYIEILAASQVIARHPRAYASQQDVLDPLHYLPLLAQRPGAFEHAQPLRQWRKQWPPVYEALLTALRQQQPSESQAIRSFIQILQLHQDHAPQQIEIAITQALEAGLSSPTGVRFCLNRLLDPTPLVSPLDLARHPELAAIGQQPAPLARYNQFLRGVAP